MTMRKTTAHNKGGCRQLITQWPIRRGISDAVPSIGGKKEPGNAAGVTSNTKDKTPHENKYHAFTHHQQIGSVTECKSGTKRRKRTIGLRHYTTILFLILYALTMEVEMNDASASSKRPAPLSSLGAAKKRIDDHQSPEGKQTRFIEPEPDETTVSTKLNKHIANPFLETLPESKLTLAKTPYETLFGEDVGDSRALHDDLQTILVLAARWIYDTTMISQEQIKKIKEASCVDPILTIAKWTKLNRHLFNNDEDAIQVKIIVHYTEGTCRQFKDSKQQDPRNPCEPSMERGHQHFR
jgi:hypothetical protein